MSQLLDYRSFDLWEIRAALAKILGDAEFKRNTNSTHFLSFIVEETLAGRGDRLKGFTIATSALGRNFDFDPSSSAAVRVQANRLRHLLSDYYLGPGSQDPVQIVLPLGSYHPQFERRAVSAAALPAEDRAKGTRSWRGRAGLASWRFAGFAAVVCLAIAGGALLIRSSPPTKIAAENWPLAAPVVVVESANEVGAANDAKDAAKLAGHRLRRRAQRFRPFRRRTASGSGGAG